jgi:hypothetical protein
MPKLDSCGSLKQYCGQVITAAYARVANRNLAGVGSGIGDIVLKSIPP